MLEDGTFHVVGMPSRRVSWKEVAALGNSDALPPELQGKLTAEGDFAPAGETYPFGTHFAVVELDPDTGEIEIVRYLTVDDCGRVINPLLVAGQSTAGSPRESARLSSRARSTTKTATSSRDR